MDELKIEIEQGCTMSGLDSLYAMLAKPATVNIKLTRKVVQARHSSDIDQDSHEAPQSQLPPKLSMLKSERRKVSNKQNISPYDRRKNMKKKPAILESTSIDIQV